MQSDLANFRDLDSDGDFDAAVVEATAGGIEILLNECPLSTYCVAKVNSLGCTPFIQTSGYLSASTEVLFWIGAKKVVSQRTGMLSKKLAAPW